MVKQAKLTLAEIRELLAEAKREAKAVLRDFGEGRKYLNACDAVRYYQKLHDRREYEEIQADRRAELAEAAESMTPDELAGMVHGDRDKDPDANLPWAGTLPERY